MSNNILRIPPDLLPGAERNVSGREMRRHLERLELAQKAQGDVVVTMMIPAMEAMQKNQAIMKTHIEAIERDRDRDRGFWGRLRWLVRGR